MSAALRVLHVSQPVDAGVAQVVLDLAGRQVRAGLDVVVAAPAVLAERVAATGARHARWEATRAPGAATPGETARLARIVRAEVPDVIHLHSAKAGLAGRLAVRGRAPTVFMPHAWSWHVGGRVTRVLARLWERWAARWAHALLCVSEDERREGEAAGVRGAYVVVPNTVDRAELVALAPADRAAARELLGVDPDAALVVCVGRLAEQKGQDVLLDAWPDVVAAEQRAALVLVGDGPQREVLTTRAEALGGVRLAGPHDRAGALAWLRAADVVAVPSRYEGMALVPLEAVVLGARVVASRVAGMGHALGPEGPGAVHRLVPPGDAAALGRALRAALAEALAEAPVEGAAGDVLPPRLVQQTSGPDPRHPGDSQATGTDVLDVYRRLLGTPQGVSLP